MACDSFTEVVIALFDVDDDDQSETLGGEQFSNSNIHIFYSQKS